MNWLTPSTITIHLHSGSSGSCSSRGLLWRGRYLRVAQL